MNCSNKNFTSDKASATPCKHGMPYPHFKSDSKRKLNQCKSFAFLGAHRRCLHKNFVVVVGVVARKSIFRSKNHLKFNIIFLRMHHESRRRKRFQYSKKNKKTQIHSALQRSGRRRRSYTKPQTTRS